MPKIVNFVKSNIVIIVLAIFALYFTVIYHGNFNITFGEGPYALNASGRNYLTSWADKINLGYPFSSQTLIFLFFFIWKIISLFSFIAKPSIVYVFFGGYFIAGLFCYFVLSSIFKLKDKYYYLPSVLLYIFNVYRISSGNSDENILLFISLPIFFLFYYRLLNELQWKHLFAILTLSILTSTLGKNFAVFSIPYLLMALYFVFFVVTGQGTKKISRLLILNITLAILLVISNLFWLLPQLSLLNSYYIQSDSGKSMWSVLNSGTFFDHFRLMGFWAFRDTNYFPYAPIYYQSALLFTTFFVSVFSYVYLFSLRQKRLLNLKLFIVFLSFISYLLLAGSKGVTGFFFQYLYDHISFFTMYREPYAKFTPLYIFAGAFGLLFSIIYIFSYIKKESIKPAIIFILSSFIIVNSFPIFLVTYNKKPTLPKTRSMIVEIPDYWKDFNNYFKKIKTNQWLVVFQDNGYGTNSLWQYGVNVVGNIADFVTDPTIHIIRNLGIDQNENGILINNIYKNHYEIKNLKPYLGLLNAQYILQENDTEWRYTGVVLPPTISNKIILEKGFTKVADFGKFTPQYLKDIPNIDPNPITRNELYKELTNKPALTLYKMEDQYFVPAVYTPKKIVVSPKQLKDMGDIVDENSSVIPLLIYFPRQNATTFADSLFRNLPQDGINKSRPFIEYKKISGTKYKVIIHGAKSTFPLVFTNNFNIDWKIYLKNYRQSVVNLKYLSDYKIIPGNNNSQMTKQEVNDLIIKKQISAINASPDFISKNFQNTIQNDNLSDGNFYETWLSSPLDERFHLTANGFANSWIIDPAVMCSSGRCQKNGDGFDIEMIIEYQAQKFFLMQLAIAIGILTFSIFFLIFRFLLKIDIKNKN